MGNHQFYVVINDLELSDCFVQLILVTAVVVPISNQFIVVEPKESLNLVVVLVFVEYKVQSSHQILAVSAVNYKIIEIQC